MQIKNSEYMNKLIHIFASFSEEQRRDIYNYFMSIYGKKYSDEMTTNYTPKGKAKAVSVDSEPELAPTFSWFDDTDKVRTASKKDIDLEENYWLPLLGKDMTSKMMKDYKNPSTSKPKTTSGQTKVASKKKVK